MCGWARLTLLGARALFKCSRALVGDCCRELEDEPKFLVADAQFFTTGYSEGCVPKALRPRFGADEGYRFFRLECFRFEEVP
ncbi:hypothetical protein GBA52_023040 [Prunus armeniaca]|nr:hypothetical protein GBA52_023040 [Prunus armeniaca]